MGKRSRIRYNNVKWGKMIKERKEAFVKLFKHFSEEAYKTAKEKGWCGKDKEPYTIIELLLNLHAEVSEAFEAMREGNPKDMYCPAFTSLETELADVIIRIMTASESMGLKISEAIISKMEYNKTRSYRHGNKRY